LTGDVVDMDALKAADLVRNDMTRARIFLAGSVDRALTVKGLGVSKGARAAIEQAGGKVED
jgi:large subunit ribosomal protein L15